MRTPPHHTASAIQRYATLRYDCIPGSVENTEHFVIPLSSDSIVLRTILGLFSGSRVTIRRSPGLFVTAYSRSFKITEQPGEEFHVSRNLTR